MCRNHHQEKMCKNPKVKYFRNVWNVRNAKVKFPKVKYFRNLWNVWNVKKKWENGKKKYKILKNLWKIIFENFVI